MKLEIHYCIPNVESDSNCFFSGRDSETPVDALIDCQTQAKSWVNSLRSEGHEVSAWDNEGRNY